MIPEGQCRTEHAEHIEGIEGRILTRYCVHWIQSKCQLIMVGMAAYFIQSLFGLPRHSQVTVIHR